MASELAFLSTTLLTAAASKGAAVSEEDLSDIEWPLLSAALQELRLRWQEELTVLSAALETATTAPSVSVSISEDDVAALNKQLVQFAPQWKLAEDHFRALETLVRPKLDQLHRLQSRAKYLDVAVQVETRSQEAKQKAQQATPDALEAFKSFAEFVAALPDEYQVIKREGARRVETLSVDLRLFGVENLQRALQRVGWPEPLTTQQELTDKETELRVVATSFGYLLMLQLSQQQSELKTGTTDLWAIDCVLEPLLLRFRYHFERSESATNRLAKPEWYLSYVQEQTRLHTRFLAAALTPELHQRREEVHCWDAQVLLLRGLVKAICHKLEQDLPTLLANPPLLCHTLDEVLLFEQAIDDDVGYGSWASADRRAYPRCVDVFTSSTDVLFAWTSADVEYADQVMSSSLDIKPSGDDEFAQDIFRSKQESIWQLEVGVRELQETTTKDYTQELLPPAALQFVALLDFLSQRFTLMETEEHRYLYVMQVHLPLLRRFGQLCDARGRQLINKLTKKSSEVQIVQTWRELFVVVNALQHVAHTLAAWEQSSVFLELSKKVARSETTRAQVLRMHMAYSKQVLSRAAKAASTAVLTSEEATAVRHALAGPGAMIGPTAAFSAAYSVGSKTMKSLFRRGEAEGSVDDAQHPAQDVDDAPVDGAALAVLTTDDIKSTPANNSEADSNNDDPETLVFSHTIFERQISELKSLGAALLEGAKDTLLSSFERDIDAYRSSSFWTDEHDDSVLKSGVSSELASSYTRLSCVLACARKVMLPECWPALLKSLAATLDSALFDAFYNPSPPEDSVQISSSGERQFAADIETLVAIFAAGSSKALPRSYLRLTREVCRLLEMPASKLREVGRALDDESVAEATDSPEQLTTMLEACGIFSLTPTQVLRICTVRLDLDGRNLDVSS